MIERLPIITGAEWREQADNEPPAIIDHLLPAASLAFIAGEPGVGKSWLVWELVLSVLSKRPFMGEYPVTSPGRVLVIASEGSRRASIGRAWALAKAKGLDPNEALQALHLIWRAGFDLLNPAHIAQTVEHVRAHGVRLVVIDTLHGTWGGRENDSDAWSQVLKTGLRPLMDSGTTVALVHHTAKQSDSTNGRRTGQLMRGSSALHGSRDCLLVLGRDNSDNARVRVTVELRDDAPVPPFTFATPPAGRTIGVGDSYDLGWEPSSPAPAPVERSTRVLRAVQDQPHHFTRDTLAKEVGGRRTTTLKLIDDAISDGSIVATTQGRLQPSRPDGNADGNGAGTGGNAYRNDSHCQTSVPVAPVAPGGNAPPSRVASKDEELVF